VPNRYLENDAVISDCGKYRYLLRRTWDHAKPRALYVMLNPSTADAQLDDPTIRSCVRLAAGLGYGSMEVVNLFAYRATKPDELLTASDPYGQANEDHVKRALARCDIPILAWGAWPPAHSASAYIRNAIRATRPAAFCFGKTKDGAPKHPLYVKSGTPLQNYGC
jgi:hypothetical protein